MNYAIEYTPNPEEGTQRVYVDRGLFEFVLFQNHPESLRFEDDTRVVTDTVGAYYA